MRVAIASALISAAFLTGVPVASAADGSLRGTVTEAGTGTALGGVAARAYCWNVAGYDAGQVCGETQTAGDGTYAMSLAPGSYKVEFDGLPDHERRFYGGGTDLSSSSSLVVSVSAGATTSGINLALVPLRTVSGTVTGGGNQLQGINVTAYQLVGASWAAVQGALTGPDGAYALHLRDGTYRVGFSDSHGPYRTVFFDGAADVEHADDVSVAGGPVSGIDADMALNHPITGTVTVDGVAMPAVVVTAFQQTAGETWEAVKVTETRSDGSFALYLPDGVYRVQFKTWQARFDTVYYDGASSVEDATDVIVAGAEVPGINATIFSGDPQTGPAITGSVALHGGGEPLEGINVTAWRWYPLAAEWRPVRQASTGPDGSYALYVPEGTYRVGFSDNVGRYQAVYYNGAAVIEDADDVVVPTAGAPNVDAKLVENHSINGLITADASPALPPGGIPPTRITAWRFNEQSSDWVEAQDAFVGLDGRYVLYVPDGTYRVGFTEFSGAYEQPLFYDGVDDVVDGKDVVVAGEDVLGIDAHLVLENTAPALTWPAAAALSAAGEDAWHPRVGIGPGGTATAVWYRRVGANTRVQASTRRDDGPFSAATFVSEPGADASDPELAVGARGTTVAVWRSWDGTHYRAKAAVMSPKGAWSSPATLSAAGGDAWDPRVAATGDGTAIVTWRQSDGAGSSVQVASRAPSASWSRPVTLAGGDAWDPQVAASSDGTAAVVWTSAVQSNYRVQASTLAGNGAWSASVPLSAAGADAWDPQVAAGQKGAAAVVWRRWDGSNDRIESASRRRTGSWSAPVTLSAAGRNAYDAHVATSPEGTTTAVWARWTGAYDRVQAASRPADGTWSAPVNLSRAGHAARSPQVAADTDGTATTVWRDSDGFGASVAAASRPAGGSWSSAATLAQSDARTYDPHVASGPAGAVAAVWEWRDAGRDRVQGVVRIDPLGRRATQCRNEYGVDLNVLFGVPDQFVYGDCRTVTAGAKWRPLTYWFVNTLYDAVPSGYIPAAGTPLDDLKAKLKAVKVVIDGGTKRQSTVVVSPDVALRTDRTYRDFSANGFPYPMAVTIPRIAPLGPGDHTVQVIWRLSAQHCDGFTDVAEFSCLPSGDVSFGTRRFSVVDP